MVKKRNIKKNETDPERERERGKPTEPLASSNVEEEKENGIGREG